MSIGLLALAITTTGVAVAATGQLVNITDGTTAANVAKVDATGRLLTTTTVTGGPIVAARATAPAFPFRVLSSIPNYYNGGSYVVVLHPTAATLALTGVSLTSYVTNTGDWEVYLYQVPGQTDAECSSNLFSAPLQEFDVVNVPAHTTVSRTFADGPLVFKPYPTSPKYCLMSGAGPTASSNPGADTTLAAVLTGYVVSGTFPAVSGLEAGAPGAGSGRLGQPR